MTPSSHSVMGSLHHPKGTVRQELSPEQHPQQSCCFTAPFVPSNPHLPYWRKGFSNPKLSAQWVTVRSKVPFSTHHDSKSFLPIWFISLLPLHFYKSFGNLCTACSGILQTNFYASLFSTKPLKWLLYSCVSWLWVRGNEGNGIGTWHQRRNCKINQVLPCVG